MVYEILLSELEENDLATPVGELTQEQLDLLVDEDKAILYGTLGEFQAAFNDEGVSDLNYIRFVSDDDEVNIYL